MKNKGIISIVAVLIIVLSTTVLATEETQGISNNDQRIINRVESLELIDNRMKEISTTKEYRDVEKVIGSLINREVNNIEDFDIKFKVLQSLDKGNISQLASKVLNRESTNVLMKDYARIYKENNEEIVLSTLRLFKSINPDLNSEEFESFLKEVDNLPEQEPKIEFLEEILTEETFDKSYDKISRALIMVIGIAVIGISTIIYLTYLYNRKIEEIGGISDEEENGDE